MQITPYNLELELRCHEHKDEMLLDEATGDGIRPSQLCPQCDALQCVDVVRQLYVKR